MRQATTMKLITAIIRPEQLDDVQVFLEDQDFDLMTVSDVRGWGRQHGLLEVYRGQEVGERLIPKLKLEIAVNDDRVDAAVDAIVRGARTGETGRLGDGKIFITTLEECIRIRTGETGATAIAS
jgi:nitrogen regulatory protein P-II 2